MGERLVWVSPPPGGRFSTPKMMATTTAATAAKTSITRKTSPLFFLFDVIRRFFPLFSSGEEGESATIFSGWTFELLELDVVDHGLN